MAFKNFRQLALAALVVVASSLVASADAVVSETIISFENATTRTVTATVGATSSASGGYGTEIKGTSSVVVDPYSGSYPAGFITGYPTGTVYETIDIKSTDFATGSPTFSQDYSGTFTISSATNGGGTVYATGSILGNITARAGNTTFSLNTTTNPAGTGPSTNPQGAVFTGGQLTGSLIRPYYTNAFGVDLNLRLVQSLALASSGGNSTVSFGGAAFDSGSVSGYVPEPSTFSLLGLGAAGLAFGAYRRRKAAAAV